MPTTAWNKDWVVHAQHAGRGEKVLEYLGRYVFRMAITHSRLERLENGHVTFRYRDNRTQQTKRLRLPVAEFLQRFLQQVLPKGWAKVRHYGLSSSACGQRHTAAKALLTAAASPLSAPVAQTSPALDPVATSALVGQLCPLCRIGRLIWLRELRPQKKIPP